MNLLGLPFILGTWCFRAWTPMPMHLGKGLDPGELLKGQSSGFCPRLFFWGSCFSIIKSTLLSPFFKGLDRLPTLKFPCCMLPLGKVWGCHTPPRWYRKAGFSWKAQRIWPFISRPTRPAIAVLQFKSWRLTWWNRRVLRFPVVAPTLNGGLPAYGVFDRQRAALLPGGTLLPSQRRRTFVALAAVSVGVVKVAAIRKCHRFWPIDKTNKKSVFYGNCSLWRILLDRHVWNIWR